MKSIKIDVEEIDRKQMGNVGNGMSVEISITIINNC